MGATRQIRAWLPPAVSAFPHMCHLVGNIGVTLDGGSRAGAHAVPEPGGGAPAGRGPAR